MGFSQLFVKHERTGIMDFSSQYEYDYSCFLVEKADFYPQVST